MYQVRCWIFGAKILRKSGRRDGGLGTTDAGYASLNKGVPVKAVCVHEYGNADIRVIGTSVNPIDWAGETTGGAPPVTHPTGTAGPQQLRRLLEAVLTIGNDLDLDSALQQIIEVATDLAGATYGALGVLDPSGTSLSQFLTAGIDDDLRATVGALPKGHGLLGTLISDAKPLRLPNLGEHPDSFGFPPNHPAMAAFLGVPIRVRDQVFGNLYLCNKADGETFSDIDEEIMVALATAAGVAIENARLHGRVADLALIGDRERIARDLHDTVIQRLFAVGLSLQGTLKRVEDPEILSRIDSAVDELDATVREIRSAIFELHDVRLPGRSVRQEVLALVADSTRTLGFEPRVTFDGPIDVLVGETLGGHIVAVLREALSNIARHAEASAAEITLMVVGNELELNVGDNGKGPDSRLVGGRGLGNIAARAEELGGSATLVARADSGASLSWRVPADA